MNLLHANDRPGEYPRSWYADTALPLAPFAPLKGEVRADLCVVGGGFTGLSAALHAAQSGLSVVLLDAQRVGFGASGRNGGQVGSGHRQLQSWLEARMGHDAAKALWALSEDAKALTRSLVAAHAPEAGFKPGIAHLDWAASDVPHTHAEAAHLAKTYGYDQIRPLDRAETQALVGSDAYQGGWLDQGAGHLHPLRYALGLARACASAGAQIFERTEVHRIAAGAPALVQTDRGRVLADHVILATNGYMGGLDRSVAARVMPINNFILATEPLGHRAARILSRDVAVADSKFVVNYFRLSEDQRLLFGGGESYGYKFPADIAATVRKPMLEVFPQLADVAITHAWGGTLAITMTRMPYVARLSPNIFNASGYSGHGVALAGLAGKLMAQAVVGDASGFDLLSRLPAQRFPGGSAFRSPLLALAMTWFAMRDRLGL